MKYNNGKIQYIFKKIKIRKIIKKIIRPYNLAIFGCIIVILASMFVIFKPDTKNTTTEKSNTKTEIIKTEEKEITEENARKLAKKQFKKLGEKNIKEKELNVEKIQRKGEEYYYITSEKNTLEIKIDSGKITRVNSVAVE